QHALDHFALADHDAGDLMEHLVEERARLPDVLGEQLHVDRGRVRLRTRRGRDQPTVVGLREWWIQIAQRVHVPDDVTNRAPAPVAWIKGGVYLRGMAEQPTALGPVDFSTHVLSLASTVLIALGKMPGPDGEDHEIDLETARHLIDVLAMLEQKTKGNLDEPEQKLLASLISDL